MAALNIPAPTNDDRLDHAKAVWREGRPSDGEPSNRQICVDYGGGAIAQTYVGSVPDWGTVLRWRWGWAPL